MSVIAELLNRAGATVTGSDRIDSAVLERLRLQGISATAGHDPGSVPDGATVVVSSAVRPSNVELMEARARGLKVIHRSQALSLAAAGKRFVAVAGAHGKTSTSAMLTQALLKVGADPSCALGGPILGPNTGAILGEGDIFVAEADESDGSFLNYNPQVAIVTNIEADHLDHFGSVEAFEDIFFQFASKITPGGTLICCADDPGSLRLAQRAAKELRDVNVWTYGHASTEIDPTVKIVDQKIGVDGSEASFTVPQSAGSAVRVRLQVTGEHNVLNAAGAFAAGVALGMNADQFAFALGSFTGAGRRFELKGEVGGRRVIVDYAHHPREVAAALSQARLVAGQGRVIAVFQPHLYSRTKNFADRFAEVLRAADEVVLADIFAAREDPMPGVTSQLVVDELGKIGVAPHYTQGETVDESAVAGARLTAPGDILLLVGAGDINQGARAAVDYWETH